MLFHCSPIQTAYHLQQKMPCPQFLPTAVLSGEHSGIWINFRCNQMTDSQSVAYWLQQKFRGCGNDNIILFLLFEIPIKNLILILISERFCQFLSVDGGEKAEKVFLEFCFINTFCSV